MAAAEGIAVVGLALRVPGADDADALWQLLEGGRSAIGEVPRDRFDPRAFVAEMGGRVNKAM